MFETDKKNLKLLSWSHNCGECFEEEFIFQNRNILDYLEKKIILEERIHIYLIMDKSHKTTEY